MSQAASLNLDTTQLRIGEQTILHIYFEYQNPQGDALIIWPSYDEFLTDEIEIIDKSIDFDILIDSASSSYLREQQLLITAFERGNYDIPSQEIRLGDSVYFTNTTQLL